jgi:hypothetical protein
MATLQARLSALATAIATDIKGLTTSRGSLAALSTTEKTNLVGALNELKSSIDAVSASVGASINDAATGTGTTWSSTKINGSINSAINALLNNAPAAFDTLKELADQLAADQSALNSITAALANRLRLDQAAVLTAPQKAAVEATLNLGDTDGDLVAIYVAAKA